ncbi:hypothetical protein LDENG_00148360 [Lucifuga dentata]|nr:hypothetical protein LDENG_00148360 [Lucifuga dentata]
MPVTVKAYLLGKEEKVKEIHRFTVNQQVSGSFDYLSKKTTELFSNLKNSNFKLYYKDEDEDMVAISSDDDLMMGLSSMKDAIFRLYIKEKGNRGNVPLKAVPAHAPPQHAPPPYHASQAPPMAPVLHPNVTCDGCDGSVVGTRFKCMVCPDYDLCSQCQARGFHTEHALHPIFAPPPVLHPNVTCDGCDSPVAGTRYKCTVCRDYDLCSQCQAKGFHAEHPLLPIYYPLKVSFK